MSWSSLRPRYGVLRRTATGDHSAGTSVALSPRGAALVLGDGVREPAQRLRGGQPGAGAASTVAASPSGWNRCDPSTMALNASNQRFHRRRHVPLTPRQTRHGRVRDPPVTAAAGRATRGRGNRFPSAPRREQPSRPARYARGVEFSLDRDESQHNDERVTTQITERDGAAVVTVQGKVLYDTLAPLTEALTGLAGRPALRLVLDLSGVSMCDSSGLNLFVRTRSQLAASGGWLRLVGTRPMVDNVLHITNLDRILPRYDTVEDAVAG